MTTTRTSFVCKSITSFAVNTQLASLRLVTEDNYVQFLKSPPCVGYNSFFSPNLCSVECCQLTKVHLHQRVGNSITYITNEFYGNLKCQGQQLFPENVRLPQAVS